MLMFFLLLIFIAIAVGLAWFLIAHDHGEKEPVGALWLAAGMGVAGALVAGAVEGWLISTDSLDVSTSRPILLIALLGAAAIEEVCKFLPLAIYIYKKRYFNEHTDGVVYFALAGLGFGLPENILYTLQFGSEAGVIRLFMTPFFHAATTGLVGYFLIKRKLAKKSALGVSLPLGVAILLHGLYNFGLLAESLVFSVISIGLTLALSAGLFLLYMRSKQLDQDVGLSVVGHNAFCRSCGFPNADHSLYCAHCGKNA